MKISELKIRFDAGELLTSAVVPSIYGIGYFAQVQKTNKKWYSVYRRRDGDGIAVYKSIDAACSALHNVGFRKVSVSMDS